MGILDILRANSPQGQEEMAGQQEAVGQEDAMRQELDGKFENLQAKEDDANSMRMAGKFKLRKFKIDLLKKVYKMMQDMGIDPGNLEQVSQFTQSLEKSDPDLLALFEQAINSLSPGELGPEMPSKDNLMGQKTTNLQEGIMMGQ